MKQILLWGNSLVKRKKLQEPKFNDVKMYQCIIKAANDSSMLNVRDFLRLTQLNAISHLSNLSSLRPK